MRKPSLERRLMDMCESRTKGGPEVTCVFWGVLGIHCGAGEKRMNLM